MKERPILFSGPMVRAIVERRKTQTRRPVTARSMSWHRGCGEKDFGSIGSFRDRLAYLEKWPGVSVGIATCPFGFPGDRLWVREAFKADGEFAKYKTGRVRYLADIEPPAYERGWRPSIHMPRWASRITMEVVSVRVERVQDISEEDAQAEGVEWPAPWSGVGGVTHPTCIDAFRELWESVYGAESWLANQWVWVCEFKRLQQESIR